jgi:hypothetical protein
VNRLLCTALVVSLMGSSAVLAQSDPPSNRNASDRAIPDTTPNAQNPSDQTPGEKAPYPAEIVVSADRNQQPLSDPKSGCSAFNIGGLPADAVAWSGRCVGGLASGSGTLTFSDRGTFLESLTGEFDKGVLRDGHTAAKWADGSSYEGDEVAARMEGSGVLTTAAGDHFEGQWSNGRLNGHGRALWANGDRYEGDWRDGKADGHGVQIWSDGRKYDGEWRNDLPSGHGTVTRNDGSRFVGEFADGLPINENQVAISQAAPGEARAASSVDVAAKAAGTGESVASSQKVSDGSSFAQWSTISGIAGKKFVAVDGSTLALTADDGGLTREIVAPNGALTKNVFAFLNDRQGTVSDGDDTGSVVGVFKITAKGISTDFSDGHSEALVVNGAGGVSMVLNMPAGGTNCVAWYPEGHQFSTAERKAALAAYANRLGLDAPRHKSARSSTKFTCDLTAADDSGARSGPSADSSAHPIVTATLTSSLKPAAQMPMSSSLPQPAGAAPAPKMASFTASPAHDPGQPIEVRTSTVHLIDAALPETGQSPGSTTVTGNESGSEMDPVIGASASACLGVESDGRHWNFRNHCAYDVQFAYCLASASDLLTTCSNGAVSGSVAPNGSSALITDRSLNESGAEHNFRWVACSGGAGEVVVHLDRFDPPVGRCVRPGAS